MVLQHPYPPDIRVEKEARILQAAGHKVYLLAYRSIGKNEPTEETHEGVILRRITSERLHIKMVKRWLNSLWYFLDFQNRYWNIQMYRFVRDFEIEALHVHDLPPLGTALSVAQRAGIPIISDLHENYPASLELRDIIQPGSRSRLNPSPRRWVSYERRVLWEVSQIIVVVEEAKERLIKEHRLPADRITVVMNVEDVTHFENIKIESDILSRYQDFFTMVYVGGGGKHRGLEIAIKAVGYLRDSIPNIKLVLIGPSGSEAEDLQALAAKEGVSERVELTSWQPFSRIPTYIAASKIGLVPHLQNPHTDTTIPHKIFQYMLMGKPVVVSSCQPLKRIVEETGCGLFFKAGDSKELAKQILQLYRSKQLREDCGSQGREAILQRYNWTVEGEKLCRLYKLLQNFTIGKYPVS
jgi:glycosyltransferase involved in cell wall biosynthesis